MRFTDDETKYQAILNEIHKQKESLFMVPYQHESSVVPHATVELQCAKRGIFDTITEAVEHGYRTCKRCKPEKSGLEQKQRIHKQILFYDF